ncbi:spore-associated protein A [Streptomyces sp. CA-111067]|uniref:spore-associated protein A n=1 Tax=Streptomyces sp. CA-111067 TaxID=3240046 RepID=UPI003D96192A
MKKFTTGAAALSLALGGLLVAPQVASATTAQPAGAYGCAGSQVGKYRLYNSSNRTDGYAYLYYSSASGGTNCAVYVTSVSRGTARYMSVQLFGPGDQAPDDVGTYTQYAGPVRVTGTNGHCVSVIYEERPPGQSIVNGNSSGDVACG